MGFNMKISAEKRAIQIFNEQINNLSAYGFPDIESRKNKAKSNSFIFLSNLRILLHESSELDKIPMRAFCETQKYINDIWKIIDRF